MIHTYDTYVDIMHPEKIFDMNARREAVEPREQASQQNKI